MLTRRNLGLIAIGAAASGTARADAPVTVRFANGTGFNDPQLMYMTCGMSPQLNYYRAEGQTAEMLSMSGNSANIQSVITDVCDLGSFSIVGGGMNLIAENPTVDLIVPYCWQRKPYWVMAVREDSKVHSIAELKNTTIGMRNAGDTGYIGGRRLLADFKVDPESDVSWIAVGEPGPAGLALQRGTVDALAYLDTGCVRMAANGIKLRFLPISDRVRNFPGGYYVVNRTKLHRQRDLFVKFFRALAKSTVFAATNPDVAIKMHWAQYPESRPRDKSDAEAIHDVRTVIDIRRRHWLPDPDEADQRMGGMTREDFSAQVAYMGLAAKVPDITPYFTTDLLDDVNRFDRAAIVAQAQAMTVASL